MDKTEQAKVDELARYRLRISNYLARKMVENLEAYSSFHELAKSKPNNADLVRSRDWHRAQISFINGMAQEFGFEHEAFKHSEVMIERFRHDAQS